MGAEAKPVLPTPTESNAQGHPVTEEKKSTLAQELDPSSAAEINREVARMHKVRRDADAKERREFANFFDRK